MKIYAKQKVTYATMFLSVIFGLFMSSAWSCSGCNFGECAFLENGWARCFSTCQTTPEGELCTCNLSGGSCRRTSPPSWYWWGNTKVNDAGDQSRALSKNGSVSDQGAKHKATRDLIAGELSETHPADVIEAITSAVRRYEENGELPEVIQISQRSRSESGEWKMQVSTFKLIALDYQLKKSTEFELVSSDSTKRSYKFRFSNALQRLLPSEK